MSEEKSSYKMDVIDLPDYTEVGSIRKVLAKMIEEDGSDIHINAKQMLLVEKHQKYHPISHAPLEYIEVEKMAEEIYGSESATSIIYSGSYIDEEFEMQHDKGCGAGNKNYRFRVNIVGTMVRGRIAPSITIRMLPPDPPLWKSMGYGENLWKAFRPQNGLVIVSGPTGSGKSTLLASGIRRILEERSNEKIITLEDPIEFVYDGVLDERNIINQSSMPENIENFIEGMRPMLRRRPTIILIGESRDAETIRASIYAAQTGHLVYTTTHSNDAADSIKRLLQDFPVEDHPSILASLCDSVRLVVNQRLIPSTDGKMVAIRDILVFTKEVRDRIAVCNIENVTSVVRELVENNGISMLKHAKAYHDKGLISDLTLSSISNEFL